MRFAVKEIVVLVVVMSSMCWCSAAAENLSFNRDIRPLLSDNCFQCHGPDAESRESELRLDQREHAVADLGGYAAVVPGKPQESELLHRISSDDPSERMPPEESGKKLTKEQVELFRRWIEQGASWSIHWSFVPPHRPEIPKVENTDWVNNPTDAFVWASLQREGLQPSPPADRVVLLRRLSLDLIGLPPTVDEVDAFLGDSHTDAFERQVERLLQSPHYGERWGRVWLDGARYADSDGFEKDKPRDVWFYRDWVINALNRDMPYDDFVITQIAGDLLPDATQDQRVATGFLRNSMVNEEGGIDPEQFRMEAMFDRMDAVGSSVLGLTIRCAQCHSHKYDPLTQKEYYQMFALLNNCHESQIAVYTPQQEKQRKQVLAAIRGTELQLQGEHPAWAEQMAELEDRLANKQKPQWDVVELEVDDSAAAGQKYLPQQDGSYLSLGYAAGKSSIQFFVRTEMQGIRALRLELLPDHNLPFGGPGRSIFGTCALSELEVLVAPRDDSTGPKEKARTKIKIVKATADCSVPAKPLPDFYVDKEPSPLTDRVDKEPEEEQRQRVTGPIEYAIDEKEETAWEINTGTVLRNQARKAVFVFPEPVSYPEGTELSIKLVQQHGGWNSNDRQTNSVGRFRISLTNSRGATADPLPAKVREILAVPTNKRTPEQAQQIFGYWRTTVPQWQEANNQIEALWREHPIGTSQLVLTEREVPRFTYRLERGDFLDPQEKVTPGVPAFLHSLPNDSAPTRLSYARWLVDRRSPTTARAIVNRIWQSYFGVGIVATTSDLGFQSESPSHPQLLDWLAVELMDHNWSLKHLHRLIVTSATYQQSSDVSATLLARDPANRLLARGPRFRVDAETVRDIALSASGLLNAQFGGPSVYPIAPEFLFRPPASYGLKNWKYTAGTDSYRRSLYTFAYRSVPYPPLQMFDAPTGETACVRRSRSNTPLQALTTLNEPLFVQCAKALALRTLQHGGDADKDRLSYSFRRCVARAPSARESNVLMAFLSKQLVRFSDEHSNLGEIALTDPEKKIELPSGTTHAQLAAWTAVSRVLLNLDETITKE